MDVRHEFEYAFDEAFLRTALKRDLFWRGVYATAALGLVLLGVWLWLGRVTPTILAILGVGVLVLWALLYRLWRKAARGILELWTRQSPDRIQRFRLDDEGFEVCMGASTSRYTWKGLRRLWRYGDVWLIEIVKNMSVFFPPDAPSDAAKDFLVERCREAGVRT